MLFRRDGSLRKELIRQCLLPQVELVVLLLMVEHFSVSDSSFDVSMVLQNERPYSASFRIIFSSFSGSYIERQ